MHEAPRTRALSSTPPLSRGGLDRDHASRSNPALLDSLLADPRTRVTIVAGDRGLLAESESRLELVTVDGIPHGSRLVYLGLSTSASAPEPVGTPIIAALAPADLAGSIAPEERWGALRVVGARLPDRDAALLTTAVALARWQESHRFSPLTGRPLTSELNGWMLTEPGGPEIFPRTDPAVIVAVVDDDDRLLLGSNALWEANRYSLLAGFVEAGESLEAAVVREVREECGLTVVDPVYLGSQPWPYPQSLMLGFRARVDASREQKLVPDGEEILDLRWFSRDELRAARDIMLPGSSSIAAWIIEQWLGEPLPQPAPAAPPRGST